MNDIDRLFETLSRARFHFNTETDLQNGIEQWLTGKFEFRREVELNDADRIDFLVGAVGVEVKIGGSRADVIRQLHRYAQCDQIEALLLVTTRVRHEMPDTINNKPLRTFSLVLGAAF
jgi:hypothetical protein